MRIVIVFILIIFIFGSALAHHKDTFEYVNQVPPVMPSQAYQSGYCCMTYDIDQYGIPKRIRASYCTEAYLTEPSKNALAKWKYGAKKKDGTNVKSKNLTTYMSIRLTDSLGFIIPGKHGYMTKNPDGSYNQEKYCGLLVS